MGCGNSVVLGSNGEPATSIFDFDVQGIDNSTIHLEKLRGKKAYLIVNVARL
jgi:glutathione peroxidase-family protein